MKKFKTSRLSTDSRKLQTLALKYPANTDVFPVAAFLQPSVRRLVFPPNFNFVALLLLFVVVVVVVAVL